MCCFFKTSYSPDEGQRANRPKRCDYNNEDEDFSPNILNDKNYQALSQICKQIIVPNCSRLVFGVS